MIRHIGPKLHKFVYGFGRRTDHAEVVQLHDRLRHLLQTHGMQDDEGRTRRIVEIGMEVAQTLRLPDEQSRPIVRFVDKLFDYEGLFLLPDIDFEETRTVSQYWELKDAFNAEKIKFEAFPQAIDALTGFVLASVAPIIEALAVEGNQHRTSDGIAMPVRRIDRIGALNETVERMALAAFNEDLEKLGLLGRLRKRLDANCVAASGGNPADPAAYSKPLKLPTRYEGKKREDVVAAYLTGTPLLDLFEGEEEFVIPTVARFEHHHIVAGSGHGKTQTLQYLIAKDIEAVERGERSIVVIDSQGDLIAKIAQLQVFAPGEALHDKLCLIDPTDIEWPVSLNLFDVGQERLKTYPMLERERLTNSILELYDFVLGSLLSAEMTQKQNVIFRYVTRLMLHIPDATIHTLRELMEPNGYVRFAEHIAKLDGTAKHFFETEFNSPEFKRTKTEVLRRLWGILENRTFERMFSHPRSKLDLQAEMNAGKVILINTAKDLLKASGTEIFGRFFIALIAQAAQERAVLHERDRMPTFVYVDEASEYFDRNVETILAQARKYKIGMILAHQYLNQLDPKLREAFSANTAIKFAGGGSPHDAKAMAQMIGCDADLITAQPKMSFVASIRGVTQAPLPLRFPAGHLESLPQMGWKDKERLKQSMRERYAVHHSKLDAARGNNAQASANEAAATVRDEKRDQSPLPSGSSIKGMANRANPPDVIITEPPRYKHTEPGKPNAPNDDLDLPDTSPSDRW